MFSHFAVINDTVTVFLVVFGAGFNRRSLEEAMADNAAVASKLIFFNSKLYLVTVNRFQVIRKLLWGSKCTYFKLQLHATRSSFSRIK